MIIAVMPITAEEGPSDELNRGYGRLSESFAQRTHAQNRSLTRKTRFSRVFLIFRNGHIDHNTFHRLLVCEGSTRYYDSDLKCYIILYSSSVYN